MLCPACADALFAVALAAEVDAELDAMEREEEREEEYRRLHDEPEE